LSELIIVSAMTRERVIGNRNGLPWRIPDEYEHFVGLVSGHPVILGRTSYEIFGPDLPDSKLIVISRSLRELPDAEVCPSVEQAVETAVGFGPRVFSAGGASIYRETLRLANAMYLSFVKQYYPGDAHFPDIDEAGWIVTRTEDHRQWEFRAYQRK
jgi:dihydrofolate reductase